MSDSLSESDSGSYEEVFLNHEIYIEPNRDPYRGGYEWFVCRNGEELDAGLDFAIDDALERARGVVSILVGPAASNLR